ncbi:MAG: hypothetical protein GY720_12495, partial [bacterium]|nr:hypothetical protein [bacterium]
VTRTGGANAVLSGIFLGNDIPSPPPPPPPPGLGDWVGTYGADGYVLAAWNRRTDLVSPDFPAIALVKGRRYRWSSSTADDRALTSPDDSERRAATYYQKTKVEIELTFASDYTGTIHLYSLDWDDNGRRQSITVDDGNGPQTVNLTESFADGAWSHFSIDVPAGGTVLITATKTAGANAVIGGIFLGD